MGDSDGTEVAPPDGPRPRPLEWPFELARTALESMREELDDLEACSTHHDAIASTVVLGWLGVSCERFGDLLGDGLGRVAQRRAQLNADIVDLEDAIARAEAARDAREADIRAWDRQMAAHQRAQARRPGGGLRPE